MTDGTTYYIIRYKVPGGRELTLPGQHATTQAAIDALRYHLAWAQNVRYTIDQVNPDGTITPRIWTGRT